MWGLPPSIKVWEEVILPILRRSGVTPKGDETDDLLPMNPEGDEVDAVSYTHLTLPTTERV